MIKSAYNDSMMSKEKWQTFSYGISIESTVKFDKLVLCDENPRVFMLHIRCFRLFVNFRGNPNTCLSETKT